MLRERDARESHPVQSEENHVAGKFEVKATKSGQFMFNLKASNGQIIATSEHYKTKAACLNGIESVKKNAPDAKTDDQTV